MKPLRIALAQCRQTANFDENAQTITLFGARLRPRRNGRPQGLLPLPGCVTALQETGGRRAWLGRRPATTVGNWHRGWFVYNLSLDVVAEPPDS